MSFGLFIGHGYGGSTKAVPRKQTGERWYKLQQLLFNRIK